MLGSEEFPSSPFTDYGSRASSKVNDEKVYDSDGCEISVSAVEQSAKPAEPGEIQTFHTQNSGYDNYHFGFMPVKEEQAMCPRKPSHVAVYLT